MNFDLLARTVARMSGRPKAAVLAALTIVVWIVSGPIFGFSDTWQLVINTGTTIVTFLMVFLIQHTQNRDTEAIQIKLDELIRVTEGAHNRLMGLESDAEEALDQARERYDELARIAREAAEKGRDDTDVPDA